MIWDEKRKLFGTKEYVFEGIEWNIIGVLEKKFMKLMNR